MNAAIYIAVLLPLFVVWATQQESKKNIIGQIVKLKSKGEELKMMELAERFIGKECLIYTINSQVTGRIIEVSEGAILVENKYTEEVINLTFIIRISEYPRKKNGKKKALV